MNQEPFGLAFGSVELKAAGVLLKAHFHATLHAKGRQNGFDGLFEKVHEAHILYLQVLTIRNIIHVEGPHCN